MNKENAPWLPEALQSRGQQVMTKRLKTQHQLSVKNRQVLTMVCKYLRSAVPPVPFRSHREPIYLSPRSDDGEPLERPHRSVWLFTAVPCSLT
jgi:hypothetical protein